MNGFDPGERAGLLEALTEFTQAMGETGPLEEAWKLERASMAIIPEAAHPEIDPELPALLVEGIAARGDEVAYGLLVALSRIAHSPLRDLAGEAAASLAARGITSRLENEIGGARVTDSALLEADGAIGGFVCLLRRPSQLDAAQVLLAVVDAETNAPVELQLTELEPLREARRHFDVDPPGGTRRPSTPEEILSLLGRGLEVGVPLPEHLLYDLAVLERALTGEAPSLPRPPVFPEDDGLEEEEDGFAGRLVSQMIAEGIDPQDPAALAAWMEDFNARSYEERRAITGESGSRPKPNPKRKKQRRQAKAARRRNRR